MEEDLIVPGNLRLQRFIDLAVLLQYGQTDLREGGLSV